jgi:hypothetical protein
MAQNFPEGLRAIEQALDRYRKEVEATQLQPLSKQTYLLHATNFVRWLKGEFTPGATLPK